MEFNLDGYRGARLSAVDGSSLCQCIKFDNNTFFEPTWPIAHSSHPACWKEASMAAPVKAAAMKAVRTSVQTRFQKA